MLPVLFLSLLSFTLHLCSILRAFAEQVSVLTSVYREMGTLLAAKSGVREGGREGGSWREGGQGEWEGGREDRESGREGRREGREEEEREGGRGISYWDAPYAHYFIVMCVDK